MSCREKCIHKEDFLEWCMDCVRNYLDGSNLPILKDYYSEEIKGEVK